MAEVTERPPAVVVTSENLAEFNNARMGIETAKPESSKVPGEVVAEAKEVPEDEPEVLEEPEKPKKKPAINERMSELTAQRREAERERDEAKRERDELRARLAPPPTPAPAAEPAEPKPEDYPNAFDFARALAAHEAKKAVAADRVERAREEAQKKAQESHEKVVDSWKTRADAVKAELPDYEEVLAATNASVSDAVRDALMESDLGPRILYEIASDPQLAAKLEGKTGLSREEDAALARTQLKLIGKLETKFEAAPAQAPTAAPVAAPAPAFRAPAPIVPVRGTKAADVPIDSNGEFTGDFQTFKKLNKAGKI